MTDKQYTAKLWLTRLENYAAKLKTEKRTLEILENRLYKGVSRYEGYTGRADPMQAQAAHEDAMLAYSEQAERIQKAQADYLRELKITREVLEQLPGLLSAIATDRYINGLKWENIEKLYNYGHAQLFRLNGDILEHVADILAATNTPIIVTTDNMQQAAAV